MMIYMTNINKKDCEIEADIVRSTADTYTTLVHVFDKKTKEPVTNGEVVITSKKGEKGTGQLSDNGQTRIESDITRKDYKLSVTFNENDEYYGKTVKINFQKQYLFFKSLAYLWLGILGFVIIVFYLIIMTTILTSYYPQSELTTTLQMIIPYISHVGEYNVFNTNMLFFYITRILTWIVIISLVIGGVYASTHNTNYQNIINKNVRNHFVMYHYVKILIVLLVVLSILCFIVANFL